MDFGGTADVSFGNAGKMYSIPQDSIRIIMNLGNDKALWFLFTVPVILLPAYLVFLEKGPNT